MTWLDVVKLLSLTMETPYFSCILQSFRPFGVADSASLIISTSLLGLF